MTTKSYKLLLAYDGAAYQGWQVQGDAPTVQAELERALHAVVGQEVRATASGRTDAGVHAAGQVVSIQADTRLEVDVLRRALNAHLAPDIRVREVAVANDGFHAIRDAVSKRYRYVIQDGGISDPFLRGYAWFLPRRLDEEAMRQACQTLQGTHDFASYQAAGSPRATTVRTILDFTVARVQRELCDPLQIEIAADGFLYNMVRNLVGTLVEVGQGLQPTSWPRDVLAARDRRLAGRTAPPQGLCLVSVEYPPHELRG